MLEVPELLTERLRLRAHRADDFQAAVGLWQQPEVYRFIGARPLSAQDVWMRLLRYNGLWSLLGYGYWALEERSSGRYLGQLGFADFKRGLTGFDSRFPEAGWMLDSAFSGRGYATESMLAACNWLDAQSAWQRSFCIVAADNPRSLRVAEKLGYAYVLDTRLGDGITGVYFRSSARSSARSS